MGESRTPGNGKHEEFQEELGCASPGRDWENPGMWEGNGWDLRMDFHGFPSIGTDPSNTEIPAAFFPSNPSKVTSNPKIFQDSNPKIFQDFCPAHSQQAEGDPHSVHSQKYKRGFNIKKISGFFPLSHFGQILGIILIQEQHREI